MDPPPAPLLTTRTAAKLKAGRKPNTERVVTGSDRAQRSLEAVRAFRERKKQESQLLQTEVERLQAQTVYLESQLQTANQELELLRLTASAAPVIPLYPPPSLAAVTALQQRLTELEAENIVLRRNSVQIEFRDSRISDASCSECVKLRGRLLVALGQVKDLELIAQEAEKQRNQIEPERIAGHTQAVERDGDIIVDGRKVCIADVCGKMETKWARRGMKALESLKDSGDLVDTLFNAYEVSKVEYVLSWLICYSTK
ncbi:hypothetical protein HDU99_001279 [Rhizoclosmatium hyalinum]|nr:hypothetical protein HDU99_001279 [Rhizoclosmatium hyalinum]